MNQSKKKRSRGLILTTEGWQKFQTKKQEWETSNKSGARCTLEDLSEITGLAYNTVLKILERKKGVDKRTLVKFFMAFELELSCHDCIASSSLKKSQHQQVATKVDWDQPIKLPFFFGRTTELTILKKWLLKDRCRLITVQGIVGIGKTALCVKLLEEIEQQFDYVIWRSLSNAPSLLELLTDLMGILANKTQIDANIASSTSDALRQLINYLRSHRCLLVLDNLDNIMLGGTKCGIYLEQYQEYSHLIRYLGEVMHNSCLLLITREKPSEVSFQEGDNSPVRSLELPGLQQQAAQQILLTANLSGTEIEQNKLIEKYSSHPLALKIVAQKIDLAFQGKIAQFLQQDQVFIQELYQLLNQQIGRLSRLEQTILYKLAVSNNSISFSELKQSISIPTSSHNILESLDSLVKRSLITRKSALFTVQNIINQYVNYNTKAYLAFIILSASNIQIKINDFWQY